MLGERSAGNPHAAFDVAGAGNGGISYRASSRPYVRPVKAGVVQQEINLPGEKLEPCSSGGDMARNQDVEAHRQDYL